MRLPHLLGAVLVLLAPSAALGETRPVTRPVTAAEIRDLARREAVWCENWSAETRDCDAVYMLRLGAGGALISTAMMQFSADPVVTVITAEPARLEGDRICTSGDTRDLNIEVLMNGVAAPLDVALAVRLTFASAMQEYAEKTMCQRLLATGDPALFEEEITADDVRLPDFESSYRMGDASSGFVLRPPAVTDDRTVTL
jgi:hypothetical protein